MTGEFLRVVVGPAAGTSLRLDDELVIGRAAGHEGSLGDDPELSRRHARISRNVDGQLLIEDLGSTNGTFVNGIPVGPPQVLNPGDMLRLGTSELQVQGALGDVLQPTIRRSVFVPPPPTVVPDIAPPDNGIVVENLVRQYPKGPKAVDGLNIEVKPGEIYGFLGPNGAGKSTTVHILTTLLPPTAGTARVAGRDIVREPAQVRATIGVALQEAALDSALTAWEHMSLQAALQGVPKAERRKRAEVLLERVKLTDVGERRVGTYSGGMKRRLDLALALVHNPRVIFLDEPTTGLDPKSRNDLWEEVARLAHDEGVTVFLTTQYLEEADALADRVGIIAKGNLVAEGTPEQLKSEIGRPTVEVLPSSEEERGRIMGVLERFGEITSAGGGRVAVLLERGADDLTDIVRALDAEGLRVANLNIHAPTLDDVFLVKTGASLEEQQAAQAAAAAGASATDGGGPGH